MLLAASYIVQISACSTMDQSHNPAAGAAARVLPPLPPLPPSIDYRGPTPWSNWVIKGRVLAGAYPATAEDNETDALLTHLLELRVDTFVCLQAEFSLSAPEALWRSGQALRPYVKDAQRLLIRAREMENPRITQDRLDFLHLPIIDGSVTSDHALSRLADDCCQRILDGERLYIHCWGGHGRTGTLVAVVLSRLYGIGTFEALAYTQALHDVRRTPQACRSPQTQVQVEQVKRLLAEPAGLKALTYRWPAHPLSSELCGAAVAAAADVGSMRAAQQSPRTEKRKLVPAFQELAPSAHSTPLRPGFVADDGVGGKGGAVRGPVIAVAARAVTLQPSEIWVGDWDSVKHAERAARRAVSRA